MEALKDADRVRSYARTQYIQPARARHQQTVRIVVGDVQRGTGLQNRVANVCQALRSRRFLEENRLELLKTEGPKSLMSTTVVFTYSLLNDDPPKTERPKEWAFFKLRGIAKDVFASLGGGERFLQQERAQFYPPENHKEK